MFALTTIGQFALVLLIATFLLSHTVYKRSPVLLNLLAICLLGTVPQFFLMYAGEIYSPNPPAGLCVTQAALLEGVQCTFAAVSLSLVIDLLAESQMIPSKNPKSNHLRMTLVVIPYIVFLVFVSGVAAFGAAHPDQVRHMPNDLACTLQNPAFITTAQIFIAVIVVITLTLEMYAIVHSLATRRHLPTWRRPRLLSFSQAARIVAFTCLQALLLILSTLRTYVGSDSVRIATILLQALMPLTTFSIFGLTSDCCQLWKNKVQPTFSRRRRGARSADSPSLPSAVVITITVVKEMHESEDACESMKPRLFPFDSEIFPC
ncbi:hypothetical protein VTO73DRAFT_346 [Trametes versicolor]